MTKPHEEQLVRLLGAILKEYDTLNIQRRGEKTLRLEAGDAQAPGPDIIFTVHWDDLESLEAAIVVVVSGAVLDMAPDLTDEEKAHALKIKRRERNANH